MTDTPSLRRSFRLVCNPGQIPSVEALLSAQGFVFEPEPFSPLARRLLQEPFPLGRSLAAFWGYVYIQDRSSMLPPLALAPDEGARVLDMCASPGSKTGLLAQLVGREGLVLGNEPARPRLANLRRNLAALNLLQAVTCSWPGESLPLPDASWDAVLLDPPCSGWGTTDKNPQAIKRWQGDRLKPMLDLQRKLLTEASRLLRPGGKLVYSTCTTNVDENEGQVRFAVEGLGLEPIPLEPFPGFVFAAPELPGCEGTLRVDEAFISPCCANPATPSPCPASPGERRPRRPTARSPRPSLRSSGCRPPCSLPAIWRCSRIPSTSCPPRRWRICPPPCAGRAWLSARRRHRASSPRRGSGLCLIPNLSAFPASTSTTCPSSNACCKAEALIRGCPAKRRPYSGAGFPSGVSDSRPGAPCGAIGKSIFQE